MPTRDELSGRLRALFAIPDAEAVSLGEVNADEFPAEGRGVQSDLAGSDGHRDVDDRVAAWLDKPNPAFRYRPPRHYLDSDQDEDREHLEAIIGALEHGSFS